MKKYKMSDETRRKMSLAHMGKVNYIRTPEIKAKIAASLMGNIPWNKGKTRPPFSAEWREKLRLSHIGNKSHTGEKHDEAYKKRMSEATKGISKSEEMKVKVKIALTGKKKSPEHCANLRKALKGNPKLMGANKWNWKGGITPENQKIRGSSEYKWWRRAVYSRDGYKCVLCGTKGDGKNLNADHIKPFALYPELRFAIDNGRTLCIKCHKETPTYGYKKQK